MRQVVIDTETTGLHVEHGDRVIELAAIELVERRLTGRKLHFHLDPEREIEAGATEIHGQTWADLKGKPTFRDVAAEFLDFTQGAEWVIHNAPFDLAFLDHELALAGRPSCASVYGGVLDTLKMSRELYPGKRSNLDALCERLGVKTKRTRHGAMIDAQLLAEAFVALTRGQDSLGIEIVADSPIVALAEASKNAPRPVLVVIAPSAAELAEHQAYLEALDKESKGRCVWLKAA